MRQRHGLWIGFRPGNEAESIARSIEEKATFTAAVPSATKPRIAELAVISLNGDSADYLCIARAGARITTGQKRVAIVHLIELSELSVSELRNALPKPFKARKFSAEQVNRPSPTLWQELLAALVRLRPAIAPELAKLNRLVAEIEAGSHRREGGLEVFERDAVASAIQVFGGTTLRKQVLRGATSVEDEKTAPFLARLKGISLREDPQIIHDAITFPGMEIARRYLVGGIALENQRDERLTILNCNRQPLETTLGVDLIYYAHSYDSFVMVQYKRMSGQSGGKAAYRPSADKNYEPELSRMSTIEEELMANSEVPIGKHAEFRLSSRPFFVKLCESKAKAALDEGMVSGMYIPLQLWQGFLTSADAKGKRGGISIGWDNAPRHFNNSEFTWLLRQGWIGSSGRQSTLLSEIVAAVLESDHMLVFAATSSAQTGRDYLRDSFGRFAEETDSLASR